MEAITDYGPDRQTRVRQAIELFESKSKTTNSETSVQSPKGVESNVVSISSEFSDQRKHSEGWRGGDDSDTCDRDASFVLQKHRETPCVLKGERLTILPKAPPTPVPENMYSDEYFRSSDVRKVSSSADVIQRSYEQYDGWDDFEAVEGTGFTEDVSDDWSEECEEAIEQGKYSFTVKEDSYDPYLLRSLKDLTEVQRKINAKLNVCFATVISWNDPITVECTKHIRDPDICTPKNWEENGRHIFHNALEAIKVKKRDVNTEMLPILKAGLNELNVPNTIIIKYECNIDANNYCVILVGEESVINNTWAAVLDIIERTEKDNMESKKITTIPRYIQYYQAEYLNKSNFRCKALQDYGVRIEFHDRKRNNTGVELTGQKNAIRDCCQLLDIEINSIKSKKIYLEREHACLLHREKIEKCISDEMDSNNLIFVWEPKQKSVVLYAKEMDLKQSELIIANSVSKRIVRLDQNRLQAMSSKQWKKFEKRLSTKYNGCLEVRLDRKRMELSIFTIPSEEKDVINEVEEYITKIAVIKVRLPVGMQKATFIKEHMQIELSKLTANAIKIEIHDDGSIALEGNVTCIETTLKALIDLGGRILPKEHSIEKQYIKKYFACNKGKECIQKAESHGPCVIDMRGLRKSEDKRTHFVDLNAKTQTDFDAEDIVHGAAGGSTGEHTLFGNETIPVQIGNINVSVVKGNIINEHVDAIVATCNKELDLEQEQVTRAIRSKAGDALREISLVKKNIMKMEGLVNIGGVDLPAKNVIFVEKPTLQSEWQRVVLRALRKAEDMQFTSISFPTLGTGYGCKPIDVGNTMRAAIDEFSRQKVRNLKVIRIVVFNEYMLTDFNQGFYNLKDASVIQVGPPSEIPGRLPLVEEIIIKENKEDNEVHMTIYSSSSEGIKRAKKIIEQTIQEEWTVSNHCVKVLDDKQVKDLKAHAKDILVHLTVDHTNKTIELAGLTINVLKLMDIRNSMIRTAENYIHEQEKAEWLKTAIQWEFTKADKKVQFDPTSNQAIEQAYKAGHQSVQVTSESKKYEVNLENRTTWERTEAKTKYTLSRRDLKKETQSVIPSNWATMRDNALVECVLLPKSSDEYSKVKRDFYGTIGGEFQIIKIERIQNQILYTQYVTTKKKMETSCKRSDVEQMLWHGTANSAVQSINDGGFNRSYCGKNATAYGQGVYFATKASYSAESTYSPADMSGHKRMYRCLVLTGDYTRGDSSMRVPPSKDISVPHILYDSVTDKPENPSMFVIFHDTQAYPEHLITFMKGVPPPEPSHTRAPMSFMAELYCRVKRKN